MTPFVYLAVGLVLGILLGYLIAWVRQSRAASPLTSDARIETELRSQLQSRDKELAQLRENLSSSQVALSAAETQRDSAQRQLTEARTHLEQRESSLEQSRGTLAISQSSLASAEANRDAAQRMLAEVRNSYAEQMEAAKKDHERSMLELRDSFRALSAEALAKIQPEFLQLATQKLAQFQEGAKGDLSQRQQAIATLVEPLKQQLETYQRRLAQAENQQSAAIGEVKKQLETLALQSQNLSSETLQLRRVLSSNQARGRWGEETLRRVVEAAGMSAHCDFVEQAQSGESKPDMIVRLPGNRVIIVDAKVPDLDFLKALDAADPITRSASLASHAMKLKSTVKSLADRDYPREFSNALDHVVLFLPAESLFSAALEGDQDLLVWAASKHIMIATPASLIALLRSASMSWQQNSQAENAREIVEASQEFYQRVAKFTEHFENIRKGLERASLAYNDAVGSYERQVKPSGERLTRLGGTPAGKELANVEELQMTLRTPTSPPPQ
ncbi:MAG: hypothetical protein JWM04_292 [Verrucomicrobiales bacterium]|nr:hypothetical protein [Verrucomicrobiales bacterium]